MKLLGSAVALPLTLLSAASSIDSHYTVVANRWEGERGWGGREGGREGGRQAGRQAKQRMTRVQPALVLVDGR